MTYSLGLPYKMGNYVRGHTMKSPNCPDTQPRAPPKGQPCAGSVCYIQRLLAPSCRETPVHSPGPVLPPPGLAPQTASLGLVTTTPFMGHVQAPGTAHLLARVT